MSPPFTSTPAAMITGTGLILRYYQPPGCMVDMAATVKSHVSIPVITVGRLGYPDLANRVLEEGKADFVALGRPLLAEPDFAFKARKGEAREIRPCIGCHECFARMRARRSLSCAVNPSCGDEERLAIRPAPVKKRVVVVGGGIGGMEAARVAALRGHEVTLYERDKESRRHPAHRRTGRFQAGYRTSSQLPGRPA